jgi:ankyrin repeat protein
VIAGSQASVATLLQLGADIGAATADGWTALSIACAFPSLPIVQQLIASGAASTAVLPPGSQQSRLVADAAVGAAVQFDRGCDGCAARCGGTTRGDCADGLDILHAVLGAGVREALTDDGYSLGSKVVTRPCATNPSKRISEEHALTILQTLHAVGVDVLARGPADAKPILHSAALSNAMAVVRWLVIVAGAEIEQREDRRGNTPLLLACHEQAWAAAHALLDCGARVDVQSADGEGIWPVLLAACTTETDCTLLLRMLAADRDSLLRRSDCGVSALHFAAANPRRTAALKVLLGSALPHIGAGVDAVAILPPSLTDGTESRFTPLHRACYNASWDAALLLLAAGARVDITCDCDGKVQTAEEWARSSPACKHRGVKLSIAARAREHAAQAAAAAKGLSSGGSRAVARMASAAVAAAAAAAGGVSARAASGAPADPDIRASAAATVSAAGPVAGAGKQAKGRKGRRGAVGNRAKQLVSADAAPKLLAPCATTAAAAAADSLPSAIDGSVQAPASVVAAAAVAAVARASEHAVQTAAVAEALPCSTSGAGGGVASAADTAAAAVAGGGRACAASGTPAGPDTRASALTATVSAAGLAAGRQAKCRNGRRGAARNCGEWPLLADASPETLASCATAAAAGSPSPATEGSAGVLVSAAPAAAAAAVAAAPSTCEDPSAAPAGAGAAGAACSNAPETPAPATVASNAPEDPSAQMPRATGASLDAL